MKSISKVDNQVVTMDMMDNTVVITGLYNRDFTEAVKSDAMIDADCQQLGLSKKKQCVHLNLQLDETLHDWVKSQGINYHLTISKLISQAMTEQQR